MSRPRYSHLSAFIVHKSDDVRKGQVVARIGSTGGAPVPHLFFEVRGTGQPVDPSGHRAPAPHPRHKGKGPLSHQYNGVRPQNLRKHLGHLIRRAQQVHYALWSTRVSGEITSPQFAVLSELQARPNIDQTALGDRVALGKSTLADVVSRLVRRGLVRRVRDSRDHRRDVLRLTPKGVQTLQRLTPRALRMNRLLASMLRPNEQRQLIRLLNRLVDGEAWRSQPSRDGSS